MAARRITKEIVQEQYWDLAQFLGCYLHEDWREMHGSPEGAIDAAINEATPERRHNVRGQFKQVLDRVEDDVDLRRVFNDCFRINVFFRKPGDARVFAEQLERKLGNAPGRGMV